MQSWGVDSRFARRETERYPTKSGVIGLLAAAEGRRRTDPIEDLAALRFGVRVDQPGRLMRDFQTAIDWSRRRSMPLSERYYLADAVFVAGVEGSGKLLKALDQRLADPVFPLYLGRRSCPTTGRVSLGVADEELVTALETCPWQAAGWYRSATSHPAVLPIFVDAAHSDSGADVVRDVPISFSPERREYGWRRVVERNLKVENPDGRSDQDFFGAVVNGGW